MRYRITLTIDHHYAAPSDRVRMLLRLTAPDLAAEQRVLSQALEITPRPDERRQGQDFFGNATTVAVWHRPIEAVRFSLAMTVDRMAAPAGDAATAEMAELPGLLAGCPALGPLSPHHFRAPSPRVPESAAITGFARDVAGAASTVAEAVALLSTALHRDLRFDPAATSVETPPDQAFAQRSGVCQDFAHIMIAGLRALGIPAGYVSGFLRTTAPPGQPRLVGADAMHAWVRAWIGPQGGWIGVDPTNDSPAGIDHVTLAIGRDYGDVAPVLGVLRSAGGQGSTHSVDVLPLDAD